MHTREIPSCFALSTFQVRLLSTFVTNCTISHSMRTPDNHNNSIGLSAKNKDLALLLTLSPTTLLVEQLRLPQNASCKFLADIVETSAKGMVCKAHYRRQSFKFNALKRSGNGRNTPPQTKEVPCDFVFCSIVPPTLTQRTPQQFCGRSPSPLTHAGLCV